MKYIVILSITLGLLVYGADAQVPKKVLSTFSLRYQNIENVKWEANEGVYKASFMHLEQIKTAFYNSDGTWIKTNTYIAPDELLFCMKDYIKQEYMGAKVVKVDMVRTPTSLKYYVEIGSDNSNSLENNKISNHTTLVFNEHCAFIGKKEAY